MRVSYRIIEEEVVTVGVFGYQPPLATLESAAKCGIHVVSNFSVTLFLTRGERSPHQDLGGFI